MKTQEQIDKIEIEVLNDNLLATTITGAVAGGAIGTMFNFYGTVLGSILVGVIGFYAGYMNRLKRKELLRKYSM
jgi:uncharacterized membrane protein